MKKVMLLHGVNHNMFGKRDPKQYGTITLDGINKKVDDLAKEIQKLKKANLEIDDKIKLLDINKSTIIEDSENAKLVLNILDTYCKKFDDLDLLQKRTVIKLLISSAYSDGENLFLNLTGTRESSKLTKFPLGDNCEWNIDAF